MFIVEAIVIELKKAKATKSEFDPDSDEYFAFITGYTLGGAAFGIRWEEWRELEADERQAEDPERPF